MFGQSSALAVVLCGGKLRARHSYIDEKIYINTHTGTGHEESQKCVEDGVMNEMTMAEVLLRRICRQLIRHCIPHPCWHCGTQLHPNVKIGHSKAPGNYHPSKTKRDSNML